MIIVRLFTEFCDAFKFHDLIQLISVRMISFISLRANQGLTDSKLESPTLQSTPTY